jgi:hypothetical protein
MAITMFQPLLLASARAAAEIACAASNVRTCFVPSCIFS